MGPLNSRLQRNNNEETRRFPRSTRRGLLLKRLRVTVPESIVEVFPRKRGTRQRYGTALTLTSGNQTWSVPRSVLGGTRRFPQ